MDNAKAMAIITQRPQAFLSWLESLGDKNVTYYFGGTYDNPFKHFAEAINNPVDQAGPGTWVTDDEAHPFPRWAATMCAKNNHEKRSIEYLIAETKKAIQQFEAD